MKTFFLFLLFLSPLSAAATTAFIGKQYTAPADKAVTEDVYVLSEMATFPGSFSEDISVLGKKIEVDGSIGEDALLFGTMVRFSGSAGDDVRVAGGTVTVDGTIAGDLLVTAGEFVLLPEARVLGDLYVVSGQAKLLGAVSGNTRVGAGELQIGGTFTRVDARADRITVAKSAKISGVFFYKSRHEAEIEEGATFGSVRFDEVTRSGGAFAYLWGSIFSIKVLMALALGFFMYFVFRETSDKVVVLGVHNFWKECLRGVMLLVVMPVAAFVLAATVIGLPIAGLIGLSYASLFILSWVFGAVLVGAMIEKYARKREVHASGVWQVLFGVLIFAVLMIIPVVGWVAAFLFIAAAFGSLAQILYGFLKSSL